MAHWSTTGDSSTLAEEQAPGDFVPPETLDLLRELRTIVAKSSFRATRFSANHASNDLPIHANHPPEKQAVLQLLDDVIESGDESRLKPEYLGAF